MTGGPALLEDPRAVPAHRLQRMVRRKPGLWTAFEGVALADDAPVEVVLVAAAAQFQEGYSRAFARLAERLVGFRHPSVLPVLDGGQADRGLFLVTEPPPERGLLEAVDADLAEPAAILALLAPAADGLDALHTAGICHGAVSPDTLRIAADGTVRIIDAGLPVGHRWGAAHHAEVRPWVAPEAAVGGPPSPAGDVFGFAATAWRCITGGFDRDASETAPELLDVLKLGLLVEPELRPPTAHAIMDALLRVTLA